MKKFSLALFLIALIVILPCLIEALRSGEFSYFPSMVSSFYLIPAAVIYLTLSETKINAWVIQIALCLYGIFLLYIGYRALSAELHGPLFGYWIIPATLIFIPIILILPSIPFYKDANSKKKAERNAE